MEDLSSLWEDNQLENEFVAMMKQGFSQDLFERNAKIMLGDNWKQVSQEIIAGYGEKEKKFLGRYLIGVK